MEATMPLLDPQDASSPSKKRRKTIPTDPSTDSVEELESLLKHHKDNDTLTLLLSFVDMEGNIFIEEQGFGTTRLFGTPLHFSCIDENGERGQEKIEMILRAAKRAFVDVRLMLTARTRMAVQEVGPWKELQDKWIEPLQVLLTNCQSTVKSFQLLCDRWPPVVHRRDHFGHNVLLEACEFHLCSSDSLFVERRLSIVKTLLAAARKTKEGSRPLVLSTNDTFFDRPDSHREWESLAFSLTPLEQITHTLGEPQEFISLLLQECPDALKHCLTGGCCTAATAPFHNVARLGSSWIESYSSNIKSILTFFRFSKVDALAFALLYIEIHCDVIHLSEESGFGLLKKAIEFDDGPRVLEIQQDIQEVLKILKEKRGDDCNTILHYAAASEPDVDLARVSHLKYGIIDQRDSDIIEYDDDLTTTEMQELKRQIHALEDRKKQELKDLLEWVAGMDNACLTACNKKGETPLDLIVSSGKKWGDCLKDIITLAPQWPLKKSKGWNLYPFMIAASEPMEPDLDTIYELLRYSPQAIAQG